MYTFGEMLRDKRKQMTPVASVREMARRMEISPAMVSDLENGRRRPSEELCEKVAAHYGIDRESVFAVAGVYGEKTERYLRWHPEATRLIRKLAALDLTEGQLMHLAEAADASKDGRLPLCLPSN